MTDIRQRLQALLRELFQFDCADLDFGIYRGSNERSAVVAIWRDIRSGSQADLERHKQLVLEQKLTEGADEIYVSGDSFIPGAKGLDPVFKRLMMQGLEA